MAARPKVRLAILASGFGSNLEAIVGACEGGEIPATVEVVISDRKSAFALERARSHSIEALHVGVRSFPSKEAYEQHIVQILRDRKIDLVILAGYMKVLSPEFVRAFKGRILNIHPSLLPAYPGLDGIERAFRAGEKRVGVTVHYVDEGVDTGPVISQEAIDVREGESLEGLTERVHKVEHRLYPEAIAKVIRERFPAS